MGPPAPHPALCQVRLKAGDGAWCSGQLFPRSRLASTSHSSWARLLFVGSSRPQELEGPLLWPLRRLSLVSGQVSHSVVSSPRPALCSAGVPASVCPGPDPDFQSSRAGLGKPVSRGNLHEPHTSEKFSTADWQGRAPLHGHWREPQKPSLGLSQSTGNPGSGSGTSSRSVHLACRGCYGGSF